MFSIYITDACYVLYEINELGNAIVNFLFMLNITRFLYDTLWMYFILIVFC